LAIASGAGAQEVPEESLDVVKVTRAIQAAKRGLESGDESFTLEFADPYDWVHTTTGEWVRGSIDWMRDDNMEFDSDEFGPLEMNMREVAAVHAANVNTYVFTDRTTAIGRAMIAGDGIAVQTEDGIVVRPRSDLWRIIEGGLREIDYWSLVVDLGLGLNRGNSNQADLNMRLDVTREDRRTLTEVGYILNLGYADRELNVSRHVALFGNRVWLTEFWFVEPIVGQLLSDRFQDIRFRAQPAATGGVRFLHIPSKALWDLAIGPGYQYLKLFDPFISTSNPQHDGLVRFSTRARFDFTPDVYLTLSWVTNLTFTRVGNTNHTGFAELFFEVTNILHLQSSFLYLRTEEPPLRADGTMPAKNDYFFTLGFSLQLG
jgi:hypothetical protein